MEYKGQSFDTMGAIFNEAVRLAKTDVEEAQRFFGAYVQHIYNNADDLTALPEDERLAAAESRAKGNFGYFAGYYNAEVCDLVYKTFSCSHPIYGDHPFNS